MKEYIRKDLDKNPFAIFSVFFPEIEDARLFQPVTKYFTFLLCADFRKFSDDQIQQLGTQLLNQGMVYFCSCGSDCERAHDLIDKVFEDKEHQGEDTLMTTWHDDESIEDALWFLLNLAMAPDRYWDHCSTVAAVLGNKEWYDIIDRDLSDLAEFNERMTEKE